MITHTTISTFDSCLSLGIFTIFGVDINGFGLKRLNGVFSNVLNQEVLANIRLVFQNCFTYNRDDAEEFQCAVRLEKYFTNIDGHGGGCVGCAHPL